MSDLSGNEDIPEYRNITNENMYEFIIWANERRDKSISVDYFNMIIQANIANWIQENNITWQFALTLVTDTINNQTNIDSHFDISSNIVDDGEAKNDEEENDGFDESLHGDDEDIRYLESLNEVEREIIIAERADKRDAMLARIEAKRYAESKKPAVKKPIKKTPVKKPIKKITTKK